MRVRRATVCEKLCPEPDTRQTSNDRTVPRAAGGSVHCRSDEGQSALVQYTAVYERPRPGPEVAGMRRTSAVQNRKCSTQLYRLSCTCTLLRPRTPVVVARAAGPPGRRSPHAAPRAGDARAGRGASAAGRDRTTHLSPGRTYQSASPWSTHRRHVTLSTRLTPSRLLHVTRIGQGGRSRSTGGTSPSKSASLACRPGKPPVCQKRMRLPRNASGFARACSQKW